MRFLDVSTLLSPGYDKGHGGLISLALHPAFGQNGRFFLFYGTGTGNPGDPFRAVIAGYKTMPGNPDQGDPSSAQIILTQEKRNRSHPGGGLCFGPDGMLYIAGSATLQVERAPTTRTGRLPGQCAGRS